MTVNVVTYVMALNCATWFHSSFMLKQLMFFFDRLPHFNVIQETRHVFFNLDTSLLSAIKFGVTRFLGDFWQGKTNIDHKKDRCHDIGQ